MGATASNNSWKKYLTKRNIIIAVIALSIIGGISGAFDEENKDKGNSKPQITQEAKATPITEENKNMELRGPEVLGLQLGMAKREIDAIKKSGYLSDSDYSLRFHNNVLVEINFKAKAFDAAVIDTAFIKEFVKKYGIHVTEDNIEETVRDYETADHIYPYNVLTITDRDNGIKVEFRYNCRYLGDLVTVEWIKKISEMKFE